MTEVSSSLWKRLLGWLRWSTLGLVVALSAGLCIWIWFFSEAMRHEKVMRSVLLVVVTGVVLLIWTVLLSGFRAWVRFAVVGLALLSVVAAIGLFKIRGLSGDLIPILTWRWAAEPALAEAEVSAARLPSTAVAMDGLADYTQFLGPDRNATRPGIDLLRDWDTRPPREIWRRPVGLGWSGFAVAGRRAVTQEQRGEDELVVCYDVATGEVLWAHADQARYDSTLAGTGPRSTPTVDGGQVFTLGATGVLNALSLEDGQRHWTVDILEDNDALITEWGLSGSPLVLDDRVVINAGGRAGRSLVAYDRGSGERVWAAGTDRASYASPMLATLAGRDQIVMVNGASVTGHDPDDGTVLWDHSWPGQTPKVAQPVVLDVDRLLVSAGYGIGSLGLQIEADETDGLAVEALWKSPRLKAKFTNVALRDGYVYGLDDGVLVCLDAERGRREWKGGRYGHGQLILVDEVLLLTSEDGDVVLVEATPEEFRELTRFAALEGKTWNNPALAGRYLLVRNDQEAACFELPVGGEGP